MKFYSLVVFLIINSCSYSFVSSFPTGVSVPISVKLSELAKQCTNPFIKNQINNKLEECNDTATSYKKQQFECLIFLDINTQLCNAKSLTVDENSTDFGAFVDVEQVCSEVKNFQATNFEQYPVYKVSVWRNPTVCAKLCGEPDLLSQNSNFYCKYLRWGLRLLSEQVRSGTSSNHEADINVQNRNKVEDSAPELSAPHDDESKSQGIPNVLDKSKVEENALELSAPRDDIHSQGNSNVLDQSKVEENAPNLTAPDNVNKFQGIPSSEKNETPSLPTNATRQSNDERTAANNVPNVETHQAVAVSQENKGPLVADTVNTGDSNLSPNIPSETSNKLPQNVQGAEHVALNSVDNLPTSKQKKPFMQAPANKEIQINTDIERPIMPNNDFKKEQLDKSRANLNNPDDQPKQSDGQDYQDSDDDKDDADMDGGDDADDTFSEIQNKATSDAKTYKPALVKQPMTVFNADNIGMFPSNSMQDSFDTDDDHFFSFFLTGVILIVLIYVLYHNKSKVSKLFFGLLVEGRQAGRRRNSRGHAYRRLDTLEQAMSTTSSAPPSKIIY